MSGTGSTPKVEYRSIANIVFAWNYQEREKFSFAELCDLTQLFNAEYTFLHVSTHKPESAAEVFTAQKHIAEGELKDKNDVEFKRVFSDNIPDGIDEYMKKSNADMLSLTYSSGKMLREFFQGGITQKFIEHVTYPILVLHL